MATRITALKKYSKDCHYEVVGVNNGADTYCNKEAGRLDGPWTFGIRPARLNKKGDLRRRNIELLDMGAEAAVEQGIIRLQDYPKIKSAIDLYSNCTTHKDSLTEPDLHHYNTWLYGPAGSGKTREVTDRHSDGSLYDKDKSKFWNGYTN